MWRLWILAAGAPLGALAARAAAPLGPGDPRSLAAALVGGLLLLGLAHGLARRHDDDPERGVHLARGASWALVAIPALAAVWIGAGPSPPLWLGLAALAPGVALLRRAWRHGPARGAAGVALSAAAALAAGAAGAAALAVLAPALLAPDDERGPWLETAALDVDAGVPMRPSPDCGAQVAAVRVLAERGAHPRLDPDGVTLWLDAPGPDGRRQVHRLDVASGALACATCEEAGENRRPDPHPLTGGAVVFETDRWATAAHPLDTELHVMPARAGGRRAVPSRRLTFRPGPDDHPRYDPGGAGIVWSRDAAGGGFAVVRAGLRGGHGGLLLSGPQVLLAGGARAAVPLAWSRDARSLVFGLGHAGAAWSARRLDPALGGEEPLGDLAAVDFSADGSVVAVAAPRASAGPARLLRRAGAAFERVRRAAGAPEEAAGAGTRLAVGPASGERVALELGDVADWGAPTGVALAPDGRALALGQRRADGAERVLWIERACAGADARPTSAASARPDPGGA